MSSGALFVVPIAVAIGGNLTSTTATTTGDPALWNSGTTYGLGSDSAPANDVSTAAGLTYRSLQAANTNHPVTDTAWWVRLGAINKFKMFDQRVGSQTENANTIVVVITPDAVVDVVSLRNLEALSVTVEQSTAADGVVYTQTRVLDEPVGDWYEYFYSDVALQTEAVFTGLKPYTEAEITVTIDNSPGTAKCGELLMGPAMAPGSAMAGLSLGIDDYSTIEPDQFGERDIVERNYADNMEFTVLVSAARAPSLARLLKQNRARPILVIATDARPDAQVFGFPESWRQVLSYPEYDVFNLSMKGLG